MCKMVSENSKLKDDLVERKRKYDKMTLEVKTLRDDRLKQPMIIDKKVAELKSSEENDKLLYAAMRQWMKEKKNRKKKVQVVASQQFQVERNQELAAGSNLQITLNGGVEFADAAVAHGQGYSVLRIDVGLDTNAIREAVTLVMEKHKDLAVMIFSVDEEKNKVLVHAGVPDSTAKRGLQVLEWLRVALAPIHGKGGAAKNGLAQGQGSNAAGIDEALAVAKAFATKIFAE